LANAISSKNAEHLEHLREDAFDAVGGFAEDAVFDEGGGGEAGAPE